MNDYISKPFNKEELMQKIVALIEPDDQMTTEAPSPAESPQTWMDLTKLEQLVNGDRGFFTKMIQLFLDDTPALIEQIENALEVSDFQTISGIAHRLKPSLDHLANSTMQTDVRAVEALDAQAANAIEKVQAFCKHIRALMQELATEL